MSFVMDGNKQENKQLSIKHKALPKYHLDMFPW
jgi:hypothetical protein